MMYRYLSNAGFLRPECIVFLSLSDEEHSSKAFESMMRSRRAMYGYACRKKLSRYSWSQRVFSDYHFHRQNQVNSIKDLTDDVVKAYYQDFKRELE